MAYLFLTEDEREVGHMANTRAKVFAGITLVAANIYEVDFCFIETDPWYKMSGAEQFCTLVEKAFAEPTDMLGIWVRYAAGMYEAIKGQRYRWVWGHQALEPCRYHGYAPPPDRLSSEVIGPRV